MYCTFLLQAWMNTKTCQIQTRLEMSPIDSWSNSPAEFDNLVGTTWSLPCGTLLPLLAWTGLRRGCSCTTPTRARSGSRRIRRQCMFLDCCLEDESAAFACCFDGSVTSQGNVEIETQARAKALPACIIPVLSDLLDRAFYCIIVLSPLLVPFAICASHMRDCN
jgi:hypothetical protein